MTSVLPRRARNRRGLSADDAGDEVWTSIRTVSLTGFAIGSRLRVFLAKETARCLYCRLCGLERESCSSRCSDLQLPQWQYRHLPLSKRAPLEPMRQLASICSNAIARCVTVAKE